MDRKTLNKLRLLFVRGGCEHCRIYLEFIESINANLPLDKRIRVIDCARAHKNKLIDDPLISIFKTKFQSYPCLIIDGFKLEGINSRWEIECFLKSRLYNEFIFKPKMNINLNGEIIDLRFNKKCEYKNWFGRRLICSE